MLRGGAGTQDRKRMGGEEEDKPTLEEFDLNDALSDSDAGF